MAKARKTAWLGWYWGHAPDCWLHGGAVPAMMVAILNGGPALPHQRQQALGAAAGGVAGPIPGTGFTSLLAGLFLK